MIGPDELVGGAGDADRWWRRRAARVALVGAAVLGVAVWQPDLGLELASPAPPRPSAEPTSRPAPTDGADVPVQGFRWNVVTWDARGDLIRDRAFVSEGVRTMRLQGQPVARVFFAGRLPDGGRLLLTGRDVYDDSAATTEVHALRLAPGTSLSQARVEELAPLSDEDPLIVWARRGDGDRVLAVVLSEPGPARVELSPAVDFRADGAPARTWTEKPSGDGVVVSDLGARADPVIAVRATVGGGEVTTMVRILPARLLAPLRVQGVTDPAYTGPLPVRLHLGLRIAAGQVADLDRSRLRVLWSGAPWAQRRLALVLVTRPDGVRLQVLVGEQQDQPFVAGVRALPAGLPDDAPFLLEPFSPQDPTFLLCPTGPGSVVYRQPGRPVRRVTVRATGTTVLVEPGPSAPSARGAEVTLLAPDGRRLSRTVLPSFGLDDPLALATQDGSATVR